MPGRDAGNGVVARLQLVDGVALLRPEEQVLQAMLDGWRNQQLARNLAFSTIEQRERKVQAFFRYTNAFPWEWTPQLADEWFADLRSVRHCTRSTLRSYQDALRSFGDYITSPAYDWPAECERRFGTFPIPVIHEDNSAAHVQDIEASPRKRAFTLDELQAFFDHADDQVVRARDRGRKGWLPAFRDAALFKTAYAYGLRRNEVRMLDTVDIGRNPAGAEFGDFGLLRVRFGKAKKGSPPKQRSVATVFAWAPVIIEEWLSEIRPLLVKDPTAAFWPSERAPRIGLSRIDSRFAAYRDALGLDPGLDVHSLRRSYATHLIEDGYDPLFVQFQLGHEHASTTSLYTCVSSDFRIRTIRRALDRTVGAVVGQTGGNA